MVRKSYSGFICEYVDLFGGRPIVGVIIKNYFSDDWEEELFEILGPHGVDFIPHRGVINIFAPQ